MAQLTQAFPDKSFSGIGGIAEFSHALNYFLFGCGTVQVCTAAMLDHALGPNVIRNLTKSMAQEWVGWNVRVNVLSPGPFMSEMMEGGERTAPGFMDMVASGTLMKRVADPGEIVGPVLYLASEASSFVTGDDISVSGGMQK